jgi:hypothetical protein
MANATLTNASTTSTEHSLMVGTPHADGRIRRYQTDSLTIYGKVLHFHPEMVEGDPVEYGLAYSPISGEKARFRNILVDHRCNGWDVYLVTVFANQADGISDLMEVQTGECISIVATSFTSKSRRFVNTHRVWSVLDPAESEALRRSLPECHSLGMQGKPLTETLLPRVQALVEHGTNPERLCLNQWSKYIP